MKPENVILLTTNDFGKTIEDVSIEEFLEKLNEAIALRPKEIVFSKKLMDEFYKRKLINADIIETSKANLAHELLNEFFELVTDLDDDQPVPEDNIAHFWLMVKSSPTVMSTNVLNVKQFEILRSILTVRKVNNMHLK